MMLRGTCMSAQSFRVCAIVAMLVAFRTRLSARRRPRRAFAHRPFHGVGRAAGNR